MVKLVVIGFGAVAATLSKDATGRPSASIFAGGD
jgi:hypothetical protein